MILITVLYPGQGGGKKRTAEVELFSLKMEIIRYDTKNYQPSLPTSGTYLSHTQTYELERGTPHNRRVMTPSERERRRSNTDTAQDRKGLSFLDKRKGNAWVGRRSLDGKRKMEKKNNLPVGPIPLSKPFRRQPKLANASRLFSIPGRYDT